MDCGTYSAENFAFDKNFNENTYVTSYNTGDTLVAAVGKDVARNYYQGMLANDLVNKGLATLVHTSGSNGAPPNTGNSNPVAGASDAVLVPGDNGDVPGLPSVRVDLGQTTILTNKSTFVPLESSSADDFAAVPFNSADNLTNAQYLPPGAPPNGIAAPTSVLAPNNSVDGGGRHQEWDDRANNGKVRDLTTTKDPVAKAVLAHFANDPAAHKMLKDGIADTRNGHTITRKNIFGTVTAEVRRENAFYGYVTKSGQVVIVGSAQSPYEEQGDTATTAVPSFSYPGSGTPFVLHLHPWDEDSSGGDFNATRSGKGLYVFTVPVDTTIVQMLSPNKGPVAEGPQSLLGFP